MSCFVNTITTFCWLDYIYAEGNIVAVRVYENGVGSLYYVLTDHLGSWEKVLDQSKTVVQQTHFDPWGNRMSYAAWNTPQTQTAFTFDRGFTGHEHYDQLHVINANARLYDPVIGRFFSPDPYVQAPEDEVYLISGLGSIGNHFKTAKIQNIPDDYWLELFEKPENPAKRRLLYQIELLDEFKLQKKFNNPVSNGGIFSLLGCLKQFFVSLQV